MIKNKMLLVALIAQVSFLGAMEAASPAGAAAGNSEESGEQITTQKFLFPADGDRESKFQTVLDSFFPTREYTKKGFYIAIKLLADQDHIQQAAKITKLEQDIKSANALLADFQTHHQGLPLQKGAAKKFWTGVVVGGVTVAAVGAGALVYVAQKKPELLNKLQKSA